METARQYAETEQFEDRKMNQVGKDLERYKLSVAALQETKWCNDAVYKDREVCIVIAADRPTPPVEETRQRGEEVAVVLSGPAVQAWEVGKKQLKAWSS